MREQLKACVVAGAIGDAWGSSYENELLSMGSTNTFFWGGKPVPGGEWRVTDDTELVLATCESLLRGGFSPSDLLDHFLVYYRKKRLTGIGASTLKAILDHEQGVNWMQTGRSGEFAAGNGAAMRIAPLSFYSPVTREDVYNACRITHKNDEAYSGALAVYFCLKAVLNGDWNGNNSLWDAIIPQLPDTLVRDRLIALSRLNAGCTIADAAAFGTNGYVVNSVPFAIFCASKVKELGLMNMFQAIIDNKGDTDTNASIAGQIAGTLLGLENIPQELLTKLSELEVYHRMMAVLNRFDYVE